MEIQKLTEFLSARLANETKTVYKQLWETIHHYLWKTNFFAVICEVRIFMWSSSTSKEYSSLRPTTFDITTFVMVVSHAVLFHFDWDLPSYYLNFVGIIWRIRELSCCSSIQSEGRQAGSSLRYHATPDSTHLRIQHQICCNPIMLYIDSLLKIHSYLTTASCSSLLLMQLLFLYWSPVGQKNEEYRDHLSEPSYKNKCSVPPWKFSNALTKTLLIFDKSLRP